MTLTHWMWYDVRDVRNCLYLPHSSSHTNRHEQTFPLVSNVLAVERCAIIIICRIPTISFSTIFYYILYYYCSISWDVWRSGCCFVWFFRLFLSFLFMKSHTRHTTLILPFKTINAILNGKISLIYEGRYTTNYVFEFIAHFFHSFIFNFFIFSRLAASNVTCCMCARSQRNRLNWKIGSNSRRWLSKWSKHWI